MLMSISSEPDAYGTSGTDDRLLSSVVCHLGRTLPRLDRPRKAMVCPTVPPPSLLRAVSECLVGFGAFPRLPGQRIILAAVARPGVERVDHVLQFRRQLRHGRSEEHTSELQSLPTRRSSDLIRRLSAASRPANNTRRGRAPRGRTR